MERAINLSDDDVRSVLDGATELSPPVLLPHFGPSDTQGYDWTWRGRAPIRSEGQQRRHPSGCWQDVRHEDTIKLCPFGAPGDVVAVREAYASHGIQLVAYRADGVCGAWIGDGGGGRFFIHHGWLTKYERRNSHEMLGRRWGLSARGGQWNPAKNMPAWATRIKLLVTAVAIENDGVCWRWRVKFERVTLSAAEVA